MIRSLEIVDHPVDVPRPTEMETGVEIWRDVNGIPFLYGYVIDGVYWLWFPSLATYCFRPGSGDMQAIPEAGVSTARVEDAYYRNVLPMALQVDGLEVLHASGVQTPGGVAALCGRSETGKSTLAYALSKRGYPIWSDDTVVLEVAGFAVQVHPMPFTVRLRAPSAQYFGLQRTGRSPDYRDLSEGIDPQPLAAVCLMERLPPTDQPGTVEVNRLPATAAFEKLLVHAVSTNFEDRDRRWRMIQNYLALSGHTPIYLIRYPTGLEYLTEILDRLEACFAGG